MRYMNVSKQLTVLLALSLIVTTAFAQNTSGALHQAVINGDLAQVQQLISGGADVNAKDTAGFTPLFYAAQEGKIDICQFLANNGANVNAKDQYGNTPLHYSAVKGHLEVCRILLSKGADPMVQNLTGGTPLAMARAGGNTQIIQMLGGQATPMNGPMPPNMTRPMMPERRPIQLSDLYDPVQANEDPNFPDPIRDPNEVLAKVKAYSELEEELAQVDQRSRFEVRYWLEDEADTIVNLAKAVHRQVRGELGFLRDIAEKENAKNTVAVIDNVLKNRSTRYSRMIRALEDQEEQNNRSVGGTNTRGRSRNTGISNRGRNTTSRSTSTRSRDTNRSTRTNRRTTRDTRNSGISTPLPAATTADDGPDPNMFKLEFKPVSGRRVQAVELASRAEEEMWQWLDINSSNKGQLLATKCNQLQWEMIFIRMAAVEEGAKKTVVAMDGLTLLSRARYLKLVQTMREQAANPSQTAETQGMRRGRTPGATQRTRRGSSGWGATGSSVSGGQNGTNSTDRRP